MKNRKWLDFLALLMISTFIVSVSAAVYYSLTMTSTITTAANDVYFVKGPDNATAGVTLLDNNKRATLALLKAYPNMTMTYDDPLRVRNNNTSSNFVRMRSVSLTGNAQYFVYICFTLNTATPVSLNYTSNGSTWTEPSDTGFVSLSAKTEYSITVETRASATATSGQTANIEIAIDVQT